MARASTPTILSIDRFAKIMGIIPPHFNQMTAGTLFTNSSCSDIWYQYDWQNADQVSREQLAQEINVVEEELARFIGYYPGPKFTVEEIYDYPNFHRHDLWQTDGLNVRGAPKAINLNHGKFIGPGRRAVGLVATATVAAGTLVYSDADGDGFSETATITLPTTLLNVNEIHAFFAGHSGARDWEIRFERSKSIVGGALSMVFYSWQLADPDEWEAFPTADGITPIDGTLPASFAQSVDVYRVVRDTTQDSVTFLWNQDAGCTLCGGAGCAACSYDDVGGCLYARDAVNGIVVPVPADYANSAWAGVTVDQCREPDMVKLWYESGDIDERYLAGETHDPLSDRWARTIAFMTICRLERPYCSCGNNAALAEWLREDLTFTPDGGGSRFTTDDIMSSPFGKHRGEVMAWLHVSKLQDRRMKGTTI